jgi:hypothetical protein
MLLYLHLYSKRSIDNKDYTKKEKVKIGLTATTAAVAHYTFSLCLIGKVFDAEVNIFFFVHAEAMYLPNYL